MDKNDLLAMSEKFQEACIIGAAAEIDIFSHIPKNGISALECSKNLKLNLRALKMLLDALVSMKILKKSKSKYFLTLFSSKYLSKTSPKSILPMILHRMHLMRRWVVLSHVVKTGKSYLKIPTFLGEKAEREAFVKAMHVINEDIADKLVRKINVNFKTILDVGGASGTWTLAWLRKNKTARAIIFDLPHAIKEAKLRIGKTDILNRVDFVVGDFYKDHLPKGADFAWVSAIIHQHSREENRKLFSKVCAALSKKATIAIRDIVMNDAHTSPYKGALFAINMLVATENGGTYSFHEIKEDLIKSGFKKVKFLLKDPGMHSVIIASKLDSCSI